jgi:hypothetical protein
MMTRDLAARRLLSAILAVSLLCLFMTDRLGRRRPALGVGRGDDVSLQSDRALQDVSGRHLKDRGQR